MIINIRGTNGSGKTAVAMALLGERYTVAEHVHDGVKAPLTWSFDEQTVAVGKYREGYCGGCDAIKTQDAICQAVRTAAATTRPMVVFEGVLVSTLFERYLVLSRSLGERDRSAITWAFLDTPAEVCMARVLQRNGGKAINKDLFMEKFNRMPKIRYKAGLAGERVVTLDHRLSPVELAAYIRSL
jgi:hypothetical protein